MKDYWINHPTKYPTKHQIFKKRKKSDFYLLITLFCLSKKK
nr:MAG TPA: hypothetical protein [Caudoviricetes sp.]